MKVGRIMDFSTVDYPGHPCAMIFLYGCSYKCPWCHNPELVIGTEYNEMKTEEIVKKLKESLLIDAVCITGGEPLLQKETIGLLRKIKQETKLLVKIDNNLYFPEQLEKALDYLDMISVDIKSTFENYKVATGSPEDLEKVIYNTKRSLSLLKNWSKLKEARTLNVGVAQLVPRGKRGVKPLALGSSPS